MRPWALIISCEHAVNTIPTAYSHLFTQTPDVLNSHQAIDLGAAPLAEQLVRYLSPYHYQAATVSRLLIDCNRSLNHPQCFSPWTAGLSQAEKNHLADTYYHPFRQPIFECIEHLTQQHYRVLHLSVHSFTPHLGTPRNADIGLLYDPRRPHERALARLWKQRLIKDTPHYRLRLNYPYRGNTNGFTTTLRKHYIDEVYLGFEIETNQQLTTIPSSHNELSESLSYTLRTILTSGHLT